MFKTALVVLGHVTCIVHGWADVAGALTYKDEHHVFQGCPKYHGWHHAASADLVHWQDRGISPSARNESYEGFTSSETPCSGFVAVDDDGSVCAGFRQCSSITGLTGLNPAAHVWDAPLELRCAKDANLTDWGESEFIFPVYFYRPLPYDPVRPWKDHDGKWYATIATDGCNSTRYRPATSPPAPPPPPLVPCSAGGQLDLWTSDALRGPKANWRHVDTHPMFTSNRTALTGHGTTAIEGRELVTPGYIGSIPGDASGTIRVITNNDASSDGQGTTMFFVGKQLNGGRFTDLRGETLWDQAGDTGLPQDLSVGADDQLLQAFVPELQSLRVGPSVKIEPITTQPFGQQLEIFASFSPPAQGSGVQGSGGGKTEVVVLRSESGAEGTMVGVDFESELVYIDGRKQGNSVVRAGPLLGLETNGGGKDGASGSGSVVTVHIIVDHSVVVAIFNNRTAITVAVKPSSADACGASYAGQVDAEAWVLATANPNDGPQRTPLPAWQVPKIHNAPPCNRYT
eukprot:gene16635-32831_t